MDYNKAIEILELTDRGDYLMDWQYSLVHWYIKGEGLNDNGKSLDTLHKLVKNGEKYRFTSPKFLDNSSVCDERKFQHNPLDVLNELDSTCYGYIPWKGEPIYYLKHPEYDGYIPLLWEIVKKCQYLESVDTPVNANTLLLVHISDDGSFSLLSDTKQKPDFDPSFFNASA